MMAVLHSNEASSNERTKRRITITITTRTIPRTVMITARTRMRAYVIVVL